MNNRQWFMGQILSSVDLADAGWSNAETKEIRLRRASDIAESACKKCYIDSLDDVVLDILHE